MTCTQTQFNLDAYADGELNPGAAFRVRRHLAACPACAAELAGIRQLHRRVQAWHNVPASAALGDRITALLPLAMSVPMPPRNRRVARRAAVGLAGVAAATAAGFWLLPGKPVQPTLAFADVERAMQQVQIVSWKSHSIVTDANWHPLRNQKSAASYSVTWLRRDPPAIATIGQSSGHISLSDGRGNLEHTAQGNYVMFPPNHVIGIGLAEDVESQIKGLTQVSTTPASISDPHHVVYAIVTNPRQQSVVRDGQKQILFTYSNEIVVHKYVFHGRTVRPEMHYFQQHSTWANPISHLVTRIEIRSWSDKFSGQFDQRMISIDSDFHYNEAPPPGVFDWSPPPGANVIDSRDLRTDKHLRLYLPKRKTTR